MKIADPEARIYLGGCGRRRCGRGGAVRLGRKEPLRGAFMRGDCGGHLGCRLGPLQERAEET